MSTYRDVRVVCYQIAGFGYCKMDNVTVTIYFTNSYCDSSQKGIII